MTPSKIILIRHGESQGNGDKRVYLNTPDHRIELTPKGREQARAAGAKLDEMIGTSSVLASIRPLGTASVQFMCSTHRRSRQTLDELVSGWKRSFNVGYDPRLREQEWTGSFGKDIGAIKAIQEERYRYGTFHYRFPNGESGADVYMRMDSFIGALWRDFRKPDYPENLVIVGHGFLNRMFLARWFHWSPDYFETVDSPENCGMYVLDQAAQGGGYTLNTALDFDPKIARVDDHFGFHK